MHNILWEQMCFDDCKKKSRRALLTACIHTMSSVEGTAAASVLAHTSVGAG